MPLGIHRGEEEHRERFDERLVVSVEMRLDGHFLEPVRETCGVELLLERAVTVVIERGHSWPQWENARASRNCANSPCA
ncbi:hypothetical protein D3C83_97650 [compost metagenome]